MKKILAIALSLVMTGAMLTACGNNEDSSSETTTTTTSSEESIESSSEESSEESSDVESTDETDGEVTADKIVETIMAIGEWQKLENVKESSFFEDANTYLNEFYGIDATQFKNVEAYVPLMSFVTSTVIIIETDGNLDEAKAVLDAYKERKANDMMEYPETLELYASAVVNTQGNFAYFIMNAQASEMDTAVAELFA